MKKQDLFKFSLTAMCVAVLSACGSSGGGSLAVENTPTTPSANANANTGAANSAELAAAQKAAQEAAAQKAAAEKAAAEAAAKQAAAEKAAAAAKTAAEKAAAEKAAAEAKAAADKAAAEKAAKEAAAKAAADQAAAVKKAAEEAAKKALEEKAAADKQAAEKQAKAAEEAAKKAAEEAAKKAANDATNPFGAKDKLTAEPDTARNVSFVGFKQTVKVNSNLATNTSTKSDSSSDIPTPMAVQNPHPSLDNIVVAEPKDDAGAARVYLEDFDTRFVNADRAPIVAGKGNRKLENIYLAESAKKENGATAGVAGNAATEKQRAALQKAVADAKANVVKIKQEAINIDRNVFGDTPPTGITRPAEKADELGKVQTRIDDHASKPADSYGTNAGLATGQYDNANALSKIEMDALYAQKSTLHAKAQTLKQQADTAETKLAQLQFELNTFNHNNPEPTTAEKAAAAAIHTAREDKTGKDTGLGYATKTETIGQKTGAIWVMADVDVLNKHQNFTEKTGKADENDKNEVKKGFVYKGKDYKGNILVDGFNVEQSVDTANKTGTINGKTVAISSSGKESIKARHLDDTVAEVYGYRSIAWRTKNQKFEYPQDVMDIRSETEEDGFITPANNLPLVNEYNGAKLHNVQYGRVTTKLDSLAATEDYLKAGIVDGDTKTYIASFGEYGQSGTENHYFYRGINNVGAKELELLKADPKNGTITYNGHAVAYGLNNNYRGDISIPTALGAQAGFVSGNHATLTVNLGNNQVTGSIYNKWYDSVNSPDKLRGVSLVDLQGVIADNGNIAGTATRTDNKATGVFGATLFGNGAEVGGSFASDKHSKAEQWGGVFAGIRDAVDVEAPPAPNMAVGVDKKN